jgi:predicted nucleic acid-binding protein
VSRETREAIDTSVIVAGLLGWHEDHEPARKALERSLAAERLVLPAPTLIEAYAVMTRLPSPHRLSPADAAALLRDTFAGVATVALDGDEVWQLIENLETSQVAGGRSYDGHILACARKAGAHKLLTLNERDFLALADHGIEIVRPR